jgi:hypothetical protein
VLDHPNHRVLVQIEANLRERAAAAGQPLDVYASRVLEAAAANPPAGGEDATIACCVPGMSKTQRMTRPTSVPRSRGQTVPVSSAEELIVMKLISVRPQDESDIRDLLAAYRGHLDLNHVRAEFATVADPGDARWDKLESWIRELPVSGE